jgi:hypothetical protein
MGPITLKKLWFKLGSVVHILIPVFGRLRPEDLKFKDNLCYIVIPSLKKRKGSCRLAE